ncbi:hypothetical protein OV079_41050 [Nannocystis pusilla]|jgi:hypothetical protein|uniref:Lipoprotein n=1 Tax=Nannocystis pusilla TaxID=889268 RepID=A0A9X3EWW2_9BACT|nr:hypothetical protein [Nannocystis pusilla]MCY1011839.1 hypothetical protein [Nannocystis pusilla]
MKKTIAIVFAALSVATFGCNKSKTDTANPDEAKTETPAETPAEGEKTAEETPAEGTPAEGGDAAAPTP